MGYSIQYEPEKNNKYPVNTTKKSAIAPVLLAIIIAVSIAVLKYTGWLIPGDADVTAKAFSQMIETVRRGEDVEDAMVVFCKDILENSGTYTD